MSAEYISLIPMLDDTQYNKDFILHLAKDFDYLGADELLYMNFTKNDEERDSFLSNAKLLKSTIDIPFGIGCFVKRFEDIKKALYTGASYIVIDFASIENLEVLTEGAKRFGGERIALITDAQTFSQQKSNLMCAVDELSLKGVILKINSYEEMNGIINQITSNIYLYGNVKDDELSNILLLLKDKNKTVSGVILHDKKAEQMMDVKRELANLDIPVNLFHSTMEFHSFKLNADGLIPVITQDYKTGDVLMLAYMNEEAYNMTITTGKMTYYSRSRDELWIKGDTSSHYQYVKQLDIDCDYDTILAKVVQIGAACHTGSRSCFFTNLVKKEYDKTNPLSVLTDVYDIIIDRKKNPKEGSYTNYLFDKGIDKILKKCGEEATEITIAAKNPNADELRYEIADYLYHLMVLMAECNLDWTDVMNELAHRR